MIPLKVSFLGSNLFNLIKLDFLIQVLLDDGKAERVILAHPSGIDGAQEAITEYRVMGPTINGCSWIELRPLTGRKHQVSS
jgi:23S rRNA-/tRNA-specific pseudouridylate synthase